MDNSIRVLERQAASGSFEDALKLERARNRVNPVENRSIEIDGETYVVDEVWDHCPDQMRMLHMEDGSEWYIAEDEESAGEANKEYWREMAKNDPSEFRCMVGDETLIKWALGQPAGPGNVSVRSLDAWIELTGDYPQEQWASYDGQEAAVDRVCPELIEELGFIPTVAYRHN